MDMLLDEELADLEPDVQQLLANMQQQQQQPAATAMDWVLGEYADAAGGSHSLLTVDDDVGGYIDEQQTRLSPAQAYQGDRSGGGGPYQGRGGSSSSSSSADAAAAAAADSEAFEYLPTELGASDLQRLIQQYSWNVKQHPLLLEAALAAGLYPQYALADLQYKDRDLKTEVLLLNDAQGYNPDTKTVSADALSNAYIL
jgi:hypothetical protein